MTKLENPALTEENGPKTRRAAPDSGEIEWAGGFIPNPPAPGEAEATTDTGKPADEQ